MCTYCLNKNKQYLTYLYKSKIKIENSSYNNCYKNRKNCSFSTSYSILEIDRKNATYVGLYALKIKK